MAEAAPKVEKVGVGHSEIRELSRFSLESYPKCVANAISDWISIYCPDDVSLQNEIFKIVDRMLESYGERFVWGFHVLGCRWDELSFEQFKMIVNALNTVNARSLKAKDNTDADTIAARAKGAQAATELMRIFLDVPMSGDIEKSRYVAEVVINDGKDIAMTLSKITAGYDFRRELFDGVVELLILKREELARMFLVACHRWEVSPLDSVSLVAIVVAMFNEKGEDSCLKYLRAVSMPEDFDVVH